MGLTLGVLAAIGVVRGVDPAVWLRPAVLTAGGPLALLWWQVVVRPRHRWWALGAALLVIVVVYQVLHRLVLVGLPFPWNGVVSFAAAGWLGVFAYVAVTRRPAAPFSPGGAAEGSRITPGEAYEVRFGLVRRDLVLMPVSAFFVAVGVLLFPDEKLPGVAAVAFGGGFLLLRLVSVLSRRVALRVDAAGVTLSHTPPWPSSSTAMVPWSDIEMVMLWTQQVAWTTVSYVGLQRRRDLPPLPGSARSPGLRLLNQAAVPHVPPAVLADSRPATFWRLHRPSFEAAVRHFAPTVEFVDRS
ncbi:hypothetical protein [Micromonospora sp. WMMD1155]|uniref:hypothetical protein n=1 Tax=Micromonospora sp. WMMD1155 TaxID=3016094 RepID=UPI00249CEC74|nr:hypothetical protein [Micromonospora sp. WMMD1155]WFE49433.1 hypothetical protein O7617_03410 [Micromonospora sp. WMMD1155]